MNFEGKVALITGGTSGIGEATVKRVAALGARVVFTGRDSFDGKCIEHNIKVGGGEAVFLEADLSQAAQVRKVVPFVVRTFGRLDFAFNNAGTSGRNGLMTRQSEESFDEVFAVNVKALFLLLQDELKQMIRQREGGSIVNMASVSGMLAIPGASPYIASKHAVIGLTKAAAVEFGPRGIRVNAVSPGAIETEMLRSVFGGQEVLDRMAGVHPVRRLGLPEDVAEAVVWLFSEQSSYYTGQSLTLDGGLTAQRPFLQAAAEESQISVARDYAAEVVA